MGDVRFNSKLTTGHFFVDHFVNTSSEESTRVSTLELFYSGNVICFLFFVVWAWPTRSEFPHRNADIKMPKGKLPRLWPPGIGFSTINCVFSLRTMHSLTLYSKYKKKKKKKRFTYLPTLTFFSMLQETQVFFYLAIL